MSDAFKLARSVTFEPLVNRWHATWNTVAPITGLLDIANHQIPALQSYVDAPDVHSKGAREVPGSAFVAVDPSRASEVAALLERAKRRFSAEVALAAELRSFESWLVANATGEELSSVYPRVPERLRPYVELVYDYHGRPNIKFEEGLLYRASLYPRDVQTTSVFLLESDDQRAWLSGTPRLPSQDHVESTTPWADSAWSRVFELDVRPTSLDDAVERLAAVGIDGPRAKALLAPAEAPDGAEESGSSSGTTAHFVGHASVLFRHRGRTILFDPTIGACPPNGAPRTTFGDLPERIDVLAITHAHSDHFELETLWRLRDRVGTLVLPRNMGLAWADVSLRRVAEQVGYRRVVEVGTGDSIPFDDGEVVAGPFWGEHGDIAHGNKCTYALRLGQSVVLLLVDAQPFAPESFVELTKGLGTLHSLWLNTEVLGAPLSWMFDSVFPAKRDRKKERTRRCRGSNMKEALALFDRLRPQCVFNYAMGVEPWLGWILGETAKETDPRMAEARSMLEAVRARGAVARRLVAGERFSLA